jgi:hypothetical protein
MDAAIANAQAVVGEVRPTVESLALQLQGALRERQWLRQQLVEVQATIDVLHAQLRDES